VHRIAIPENHTHTHTHTHPHSHTNFFAIIMQRSAIPEAKLYTQLVDLENKVDALIARKCMEFGEELKTPKVSPRYVACVSIYAYECMRYVFRCAYYTQVRGYMYVCMYVFMYVCMYFMYVCTYVWYV
jgi:hypothetical protein